MHARKYSVMDIVTRGFGRLEGETEKEGLVRIRLYCLFKDTKIRLCAGFILV